MTTRSNLWTWRPLRIDGRNRIAVYRGARLVTLLNAHEVDAAWALTTVQNLAAAAPVRLLRERGDHGG